MPLENLTSLLFSPLGLVGLAVLMGLIVLKMLPRGAHAASGMGRELFLDVRKLSQEGPPAGGPRLECRLTSVRLAVVVLAPSGRANPLSTAGGFPHLLDQIVPGLGKVLATHQPVVKLWPAQLSQQGFVHSFFKNVRLPGQGGKRTPWCALAGPAEIDGRSVDVGLVFCAAGNKPMGQEQIPSADAWRDALRVRAS